MISALALVSLLAVEAPAAAPRAAAANVAVLVGTADSQPGTPAALPVVPGTVMLPGADSDPHAGGWMRAIASKILPSLKESYRLPSLDLARYTVGLTCPRDVPRIVVGDARPRIELTLMGAGPALQTSEGGHDAVLIYRVRLKDGDKVLAEPLVALSTNRSAIVGTRYDEKYYFVVLQSVGPKESAEFVPDVIHRVKPVYPPEAPEIRSNVELEVRLDADGNVKDARVSQGAAASPGETREIPATLAEKLNQAAVDAMKQFTFERPVDGDGKPRELTRKYRLYFGPPNFISPPKPKP